MIQRQFNGSKWCFLKYVSPESNSEMLEESWSNVHHTTTLLHCLIHCMETVLDGSHRKAHGSSFSVPDWKSRTKTIILFNNQVNFLLQPMNILDKTSSSVQLVTLQTRSHDALQTDITHEYR